MNKNIRKQFVDDVINVMKCTGVIDENFDLDVTEVSPIKPINIKFNEMFSNVPRLRHISESRHTIINNGSPIDDVMRILKDENQRLEDLTDVHEQEIIELRDQIDYLTNKLTFILGGKP